MMQTKLPDYITFPILTGILGTLLFTLPLIGVLLYLPFHPIVVAYDYLIPGIFTETGTHVDIGFAWISFKTTAAWVFFGSFFSLIGLTLGLLTHYCGRKGGLIWFGKGLLGIWATMLVVATLWYEYEKIWGTSAIDEIDLSNHAPSAGTYQNESAEELQE